MEKKKKMKKKREQEWCGVGDSEKDKTETKQNPASDWLIAEEGAPSRHAFPQLYPKPDNDGKKPLTSCSPQPPLWRYQQRETICVDNAHSLPVSHRSK